MQMKMRKENIIEWECIECHTRVTTTMRREVETNNMGKGFSIYDYEKKSYVECPRCKKEESNKKEKSEFDFDFGPKINYFIPNVMY